VAALWRVTLSNDKWCNMKKAVLVTFDKFTDIDLFLSWDLLPRVKYRDKDFQVKIVGTAASHKSVCGLMWPPMD